MCQGGRESVHLFGVLLNVASIVEGRGVVPSMGAGSSWIPAWPLFQILCEVRPFGPP